MKKLLYASVALVALSATAVAAPIAGELSVNGDDTFSLAAPPSITFAPLGNLGGTSGSFAELPLCNDCVNMINELNAASTGTLFSVSSGGHTAAVIIDAGTLTASVITNPNPALDAVEVTGLATVELDSVSQPGSFVLTTQGPEAANVTFSATAVTVPAPPLGQTLPGVLAVLATLAMYRATRKS